jgi:predicted sulfurtransferase
MKLKALILFVALTFAACNAVDTNPVGQVNNGTSPTPAHAAQPADSIKRVTPAELDQLMKDGKVVIVDVRNQDMYDAGHIRGSRLIPLQDVDKRANELPRDKLIVAYCS